MPRIRLAFLCLPQFVQKARFSRPVKQTETASKSILAASHGLGRDGRVSGMSSRGPGGCGLAGLFVRRPGPCAPPSELGRPRGTADAERDGTGAGTCDERCGGGGRLKVHGMDGSTFELSLQDSASVDDLFNIILARAGTKVGRMLVLTSGGNRSLPLLPQVSGEEVTYVARKVSDGEAVESLKLALTGTKLSLSDTAAMDSILSLNFLESFNGSLEGLRLPSSLHALSLVTSSIKAWQVWDCQAVCKLYSLARSLTEAYLVSRCPRICWYSPSAMSSSNL